MARLSDEAQTQIQELIEKLERHDLQLLADGNGSTVSNGEALARTCAHILRGFLRAPDDIQLAILDLGRSSNPQR